MDKGTVSVLVFIGVFALAFIAMAIDRVRGNLPDNEETEETKRRAAEELAIMAILGNLRPPRGK